MTRSHLISFAYVSCPCVNFCPRLWSNLYFCHSQNSQIILINCLGHIFSNMENPFISMFKDHPPIILFLFCPNWHFAKQVLFIFAWLPPNFLDIFSCPYHGLVQIFILICLVIIFQQFSKVSVQEGTLWRSYILGISKSLPRPFHFHLGPNPNILFIENIPFLLKE